MFTFTKLTLFAAHVCLQAYRDYLKGFCSQEAIMGCLRELAPCRVYQGEAEYQLLLQSRKEEVLN